MKTKKPVLGMVVIALVSVFGVVGVSFLDPISQDPGYHLFEDSRVVLGIPNFWNVISNVPFLAVGLTGMLAVHRSRKVLCIAEIKAAYSLFFLSVSLISLGSVYYHLVPYNGTLVWDRLPMTVAFMALLSIVIAEFISVNLGRLALWPLIFFGVFSVLYWYVTERNGEGDLRLYALVQFLPMLVIPIIILFFKSTFTNISGYWYLLFAYSVAKVCEYFDEAIYGELHFLSGHSLKHLAAALAVYLLYRSYENRQLASN
ncbi:MAG: ceramidase [Gammaproteobacteria bacterium]|nr:ceramidase [Gammaproteobacteria bacterium]